ncbi:MAG: hypothetical protein GTN93_25545 [Anaerolineae bacterium]|nr:hypothetical protein [Anaerolineae bacterium]
MAHLEHVDKVAAYFRIIVDEPDDTDLDDATVTEFLQIGFSEFLHLVNQYQPYFNQTLVTITLSDQAFFNLDNFGSGFAILGPQVTAARMMQAIDLIEVDANGNFIRRLEPATSQDEVKNSVEDKWFLTTGGLAFNRRISGTFELHYEPESQVDWSQLTAGDDEYITDFVNYQDLIALYAAKHYHIVDSSENKMLMMQMAKRERDFETYLQKRNFSGPRYVGDEDYWT